MGQNIEGAYYKRAVAWYNKKRFDKAIDDFNDAIHLNPNNAESYYSRGCSWHDKKEFDRAIDDYTHTIHLNINNAQAYNNRGNAWLDKKEFDKAINDFNKAIQLDPNNALIYNNRASARREKQEFDNAINDLTRAIQLDQNNPAFYFNLYFAYKGLGKISLALCNINRATYLRYGKPIQLAEAYYQNFLLPFMVKKVIYRINGVNNLNTLINTFIKNSEYCFVWETILKIIENTNQQENEEVTLKIKALVFYFMGDCIESFRIYDEDIDTAANFHLELRDQYYYIKSAQEFLEPCEGVLQFAIDQVKHEKNENAEDSYYAGLLFMLNNEIEKAETHFLSAASLEFKPALYQLAGLYDKQLCNLSKRDEIIQRVDSLEKEEMDKYSLINGINTIMIEDAECNLIDLAYNACQHFAYYTENIEEVQLVRTCLNIDHSYKRFEFWDLIQFTGDAKKTFESRISHYELIDFEEALFKAFDKHCKGIGITELEIQIFNSNQATETKHGINDEVEKDETTYELVLAKKIDDMKRIGVFAKWFLILTKYYYVSGLINLREAICLHLYAEEKAIQLKDKSIAKEINLEIETWINEMTTISSPILLKLLFKAFKYLQDGFEIEEEKDNNLKNYVEFKETYFEHLEFWKSHLIKRVVNTETIKENI